jgi:hypothetical protein
MVHRSRGGDLEAGIWWRSEALVSVSGRAMRMALAPFPPPPLQTTYFQTSKPPHLQTSTSATATASTSASICPHRLVLAPPSPHRTSLPPLRAGKLSIAVAA